MLDCAVDTARAMEDCTAVRRISMDECSVRKSQRYLTLFCHDPRRVLFATPERGHQTLAAFAKDLTAKDLTVHGGDTQATTDASLDLNKAHPARGRKLCLNAPIHFDITASAQTARNRVRRAEAKEVPSLKGIRWGTLEGARHSMDHPLTDRYRYRPQHSALQRARAWHSTERPRDPFANYRRVQRAGRALQVWIRPARHCGVPPFKRLGATLRAHLAGILTHFGIHLDNGLDEAVNGRTPAAKARTCVYGADHRTGWFNRSRPITTSHSASHGM